MGKSIAICRGARLVWLAALALVLELVRGQPALYMFGDSELDVGNNNYVDEGRDLKAKANHPLYGIDYPGHLATGRYSNGRNLADFIADSLGAPSPPAYRSIANTTGNSTSIFLKGVNFAYGGARVSDPEKRMRDKIESLLSNDNNLEQQIERDYSSVHAQLVRQLGKTQASAHLAKSIFVIAIGSTDIVEQFLLDPSYRDRTRSDEDYEQFAEGLAYSFDRHLQRLMRDLGMRKVLVVGTGPLGCYPALRLQQDNPAQCRDAAANSVSAEYNLQVSRMLDNSPVRYSFLDQYTVLQRYMQEPQANGYADVEAACCVSNLHSMLSSHKEILGHCTSGSKLCPDRADHMFWDVVHLTEITTQKLAAVAFNGTVPDVSPVNLRDLVRAAP